MSPQHGRYRHTRQTQVPKEKGQAGSPGHLQMLHPAASSPSRLHLSAPNSTHDRLERVRDAAEVDLTVNISIAEQTFEANEPHGRKPT